jgi:hypothetical protein
MANLIIGSYSGGDIGFPDINLPVPLAIVHDTGVIYAGMNVDYERGANAQQINSAMVQKAIARAADLGYVVQPSDVIYQPFARG